MIRHFHALAATLAWAGLAACAPPLETGESGAGAETTPSAQPVAGPEPADRAEPISATPAMWSVSDADTTVYLFGTVHLLRPGTDWRTDAFDTAFAASDAIYFEADVASEDAQGDILPLVARLGMYSDGGSLTATLDDEEEREVAEAAELLGVPMSALDPMKPWMAGLQLTNAHVKKEGYDPRSGVETVLEAEARRAGKEIGYFETAVQQLRFFADLPEEDQVTFLVTGAQQIEDDPDLLDEMVGRWADGDVDKIADMMADPGALGSERIYEVLIVKRNAAWLPEIEALLDAPGAAMVAVGAGHLAGEDGLVEMLRDRGYVVEGP